MRVVGAVDDDWLQGHTASRARAWSCWHFRVHRTGIGARVVASDRGGMGDNRPWRAVYRRGAVRNFCLGAVAEVVALTCIHLGTGGMLRVYRHAADRINLALWDYMRCMIVCMHG